MQGNLDMVQVWGNQVKGKETMIDFYVLQGTMVEKTSQGSTMRQVPTFYLSRSIQGIVSKEHAKEIAIDILTLGVPTDRILDFTFHLEVDYLVLEGDKCAE